MTPIESVLSRLGKARQTGRDSWIACCPSHADRSPSLTVTYRGERVLLHCFAGCGPIDVLRALGLRFSDLYPEPLAGEHRPIRRPFPAADVLEAVSSDAYYVCVVAAMVADGQSLTSDVRAELMRAATRIDEARRVANGR